MQRNYTDFIGFGNTEIAPLMSTEAMRTVDNPVQSEGDTGRLIRSFENGNLSAKKYLQRAKNAYRIDGFVRIAVDRHSEMFKDFDFEGNAEGISYVKKRLAYISIRSGEAWKSIVSRYVHEYFQHGSPMMIKHRGNLSAGEVVKRPLYEEKPYPISALFVFNPLQVDPFVKDHKFIGWQYNSSSSAVKTGDGNKVSTVSAGSKPLPISRAMVSKSPNPPSNVNVFKNGLDLLYTPYKKSSDSHYGWGITFSALDDVQILRNIEQTTCIAIKKNTIPILWHKIIRPANPLADPGTAMRDAEVKHQKATQDSVIITNGEHELKMLGSESQTMRVEPYLKYYAYRVFADLGVSPFLMGFEPGTIGTADAAIELLMNRIRFCQQELSIGLEFFLINELLWEGGWDPYTREDHQVKLVFREMDESRLTKLRSHFADLYTKNLLSFSEARKGIGFTEKTNDADMYLNKVAIPLEMAKGRAKALSSPAPKTSKEVQEFFEDNFGKCRLDEFIALAQATFDITLEEFEEGCNALAQDPEALFEYLLLVIVGENQ